MSRDDVQVSVCVVTYNQENYIAECLESLVTQKTNFKFEIIVGEDCSTDNTRKIVQEYAKQYPDLIVPLFYKSNVGAIENIKQVYQLARGKYIAHMDGDDLALANKLQKQYEKMEEGFAICSHNVCSINVDNNIDSSFWNFKEGEYDWRYYLKNLPFFAHSSKMFVKEHLVDFLQELEGNTYDFELHLESVKQGLIYHIGENLGIYRLDVGLMVNDKEILIKMIDTKIRVYEKSLSYFNDFMFVKKSYILALLRMLKLCLIQKKYSKINQILAKLISVTVRFK